jgi:membrane protein YdbS with pleckstrin-like domain
MPEKPDPKVLRIWLVSNAISYGVVFAVLLVLTTVATTVGGFPRQLLLIPLVVLIPAAITYLTLRREYDAWQFRVTPEALEIQKGWLYRQRRIVARDRIQHIDLNSGPLDRKFGLMQVVIHTAGADIGFIPGLSPARAESLRAELLAGREVA